MTHSDERYVELMSAVNRNKKDEVQLPSPEQEKVIVSDKPVISVIAGAGSGKTRTMTNRIVYCLGVGKVQPAEILGLTFTNKAAGELDDRVNQSLWQLQHKGLLSETKSGEKKEETPLLLERPVISTYNAFASDIVAQYGMLISRDISTRLITDAERYQLMERVVDAMPACEVGEFESARSTVIKNALDLSAALLDHGTSIEQARGFFENSSAVFSEIASKASDRVSKSMGWEKGLSDYWRDLRGKLDLSEKAPRRLKEGLASVRLVERYWKLKRELGVIEFADQVDMAVRILSENERVRHEISSRYRLVLLDEYQDTSIRQAQMLHLALGQRDTEDWYSICAVGDPNQAIYGFRGASANAFSYFCDLFAAQGIEKFSLSTTYRNDKAILEAANVTASKIETTAVEVEPLKSRDGAGEGRVVHIYPLRREDSYKAIALHIKDTIARVKKDEENKKAQKPNHRVREAEIAVLCRKRRHFDDVARALEEYDIPYEIVGGTAILERPEIITLRNALVAATYPHRYDAFTRLFAYLNIGVGDIRALSEHLKDTERKAEKEEGSLPPTLSDILDSLDEAPLPDMTPEAHIRLVWLKKVLHAIRRRSNLQLADTIDMAIVDLGLELAAVSRTHNAQGVQSALDSFIRLASQYQAEHPQSHLPDFLEWLDYVEKYENAGEEESGKDTYVDMDDVEVTPGIVQIMTIHSAKGLEWEDLVVIPEMVAGEVSAVESGAQAWPTHGKVVPY
ncbi:MAG: ATP-dependent helicase, partial [Actinomycetaceae bacterium]|nr:ATP-dependent helicase [Actinomycetaceae bacterium]